MVSSLQWLVFGEHPQRPNSVSDFNELAHLVRSLEWRPTWAGFLWCRERCLAQHATRSTREPENSCGRGCIITPVV